jgi:hypothetical protein
MSAKKIFILMIAIASLYASSCYYNKEDLLFPTLNEPCDSTISSYKSDVTPVLNNLCYSCHTGASASGGVVLGTYEADKAAALNGKLYGSVSHAPGYSPMPKSGASLNTCQLNKIKKWISLGTPNN